MPIVTIETNLTYALLPEDFGPNLSRFTSETLNKPEEVRFKVAQGKRCVFRTQCIMA